MDNKEILTNLLKTKYTKNVYIKIFNILSQEKYSSNSNGIFFNLKEIPDEKIKECIDYINMLSLNIEDHMKNLSIREELEKKYKDTITVQKEKGNVKEKTTNKKQVKKEEIKPIVSPFGKRTYKSKVFKRLDNIMLGKKKDEKLSKTTHNKKHNKEKIEEISDISDKDSFDEEDLFGDYEEDTASVLKDSDNLDTDPELDIEDNISDSD